MILSIIAAISENRVIGEGDRIPWKLKDDLVRLRNLTRDQIVIIGRKTYASMVAYYIKSGRPMPGKLYLIITRNTQYQPAFSNAKVVGSLDEAIKEAKKYLQRVPKIPGIKGLKFRESSQAKNERENTNEIFIIGGAQIFTQTLPLANKLYLTVIHKNIEGDAFFPDYSRFNKVVSEENRKHEDLKYSFLELVPRKSFTSTPEVK